MSWLPLYSKHLVLIIPGAWLLQSKTYNILLFCGTFLESTISSCTLQCIHILFYLFVGSTVVSTSNILSQSFILSLIQPLLHFSRRNSCIDCFVPSHQSYVSLLSLSSPSASWQQFFSISSTSTCVKKVFFFYRNVRAFVLTQTARLDRRCLLQLTCRQ